MADTAPPPPAPAATEIPPAAGPGTAGLVNLAVGVAVLAALYVGREVFLPIVLAVLLAFVLAPVVDILRKLKIGRVAASILAVVATLGIVVSLTGVIGLQLAGLVSDLPRYETTVRYKVAGLREGGFGRVQDLLKNLGRQIQEATQDQSKPAPAAAAPSAPPAEKPVPVEVHDPEPGPVDILRAAAGPLLGPLAMTGIVFVALIFILLQREDLRDRMIRLFGSGDLHRTTAAMDDAARRLGRYFLLQLGLNASFGVVVALGLWAIGVPSPLLWGIFAGLMRFVPYIGSFIAGLLPVALAAAVDPTGWSMALQTLALFLVAEPLWGHVIEPVVYGQNTGLSPFAVVLSAIFWTWLWGPVGLIIATPLTLCLVVLGRHVERLEFFDVLLGDRPALTPAENLYQRMLAGDPDEALESAEVLLRERSLTSYYDEVALGGLRLAATDSARGVLTQVQLEQVKQVVGALIEDLSGRDDIEPDADERDDGPAAAPPDQRPAIGAPAVAVGEHPEERIPEDWRRPGAVMCVAGRGALDEAAAAMLAQLLEKHGLGTALVPHAAVSRSRVMALSVEGVRMIFISYLEIAGTPAHLRYLLRRLRARAPNAAIVVGLWPPDDPVLREDRVRQIVGADGTVVSLREAVQTALKAAARGGDDAGGCRGGEGA